MVEVAGHAGLLDGQHPQGVLHALEGRALPHEVHLPPCGDVPRRGGALHVPQLQRYLLRPLPQPPALPRHPQKLSIRELANLNLLFPCDLRTRESRRIQLCISRIQELGSCFLRPLLPPRRRPQLLGIQETRQETRPPQLSGLANHEPPSPHVLETCEGRRAPGSSDIQECGTRLTS